jgi:hypothetical protein
MCWKTAERIAWKVRRGSIRLVTELKEIVPQEDNLSCEPESIVEFGVPAKHVSRDREGDWGRSHHHGHASYETAPDPINPYSSIQAREVVSHAECLVLTVLG